MVDFRFIEFEKLMKIFPDGIEADIESLKIALKTIHQNAVDKLKLNIVDTEEEMKNDLVIEDIVVYSTVDYLDYYSSFSAISLIYNSMVISIHSYIETRLMLFCKLIEKKNRLSLSDISGKGIYKYKTYLTKVHNIDFEPINREWELLLSFTFLRNKLIHNQSIEINKKNQKGEYEKLKNIRNLTSIESSDIIKFYIKDQRCIDDFFNIASSIIKYVCYTGIN